MWTVPAGGGSSKNAAGANELVEGTKRATIGTAPVSKDFYMVLCLRRWEHPTVLHLV